MQKCCTSITAPEHFPKRPQPLDPVLQYCVDPEARENVTIDAGMLCLDNNTNKIYKNLMTNS